jgi:glycolate oxidase
MLAPMICLPQPDAAILARKASILTGLRAILDAADVIDDDLLLHAYETDALTAYRQRPLAVVLPHTTEQVAAILRFADQQAVRIVPRGAGTSLSGGAVPAADAIVVGMGRFNRILDIDYADRCVIAQSGVTNLAISQAVAARSFYYAPDPSSQIACTIGGNVAENSGGVHCLKYGLTTHNVLGIEMVTPQGEIVRLGGRHLDAGHYDLLGLMIGSEGLLGIVTEVTVRILPIPQTARAVLIGFSTTTGASACVADVIAAGIIPAGLEMMDGPAIRAAEDFVRAGYPLDAAALLIVELDGPQAEVDELIARVTDIANLHGATSCRASVDETQRLRFWAGRKAAFPAVGRISPDYLCMDGSIPRHQLAPVLRSIAELSVRHGLRVANVFHAGDGNLHPLVLYDRRIEGQEHAAEILANRILELCIEAGGSITGEHGVGEEKKMMMSKMYAEPDLETMQRVRCAFDPEHLSNPTKVFPRPRLCGETPGEYRPHPLEVAGIAERF